MSDTAPTNAPKTDEKPAKRDHGAELLALEREAAEVTAKLARARLAAPKSARVKVKAVVSKHADFHGFWSGGAFFPNGTSVQTVEASRVAEIYADQEIGHRIAVVAVGTEVREEPAEAAKLATMEPSPPPGAPSGAENDTVPGQPGSPGKRLR